MTPLLGKGIRYGLYRQGLDGRWVQDGDFEFNLIPQDAVDFIASLILGTGATPISNWYFGLFENNYNPTKGVKPTDLQTVVGECLAHDEAARPAWEADYDGVSVIDNGENLATFTFNAPKRIYGGFVISSSVKGGEDGLILSIARFQSPRDIEAGQKFGVGGLLTLTPTGL